MHNPHLFPTEPSILQSASGNAGRINPGQGAGDAKQSPFWEDEDVVSVSNNWSE